MHKLPSLLPLTLSSLASFAVALAPAAAAPAAARTQATVAEAVHVDIGPARSGAGLVAYRISARLQVGANACEAAGVRIGLIRRQDQETQLIVPTRLLPRGPRVLCAQEFAPVYRTAEAVVHVRTGQGDTVFMLNIGRLGNRTSLAALAPSGEGGAGAAGGVAGDAAEVLSGVLERIEAAGGESTGFALEEPTGEVVELDLKAGGLAHRGVELSGRAVTVKGVYRSVTGVELTRRVLEVSNLAPR